MHHPPSATYCGLTVITTPSRFDKEGLLSAVSGRIVSNELLAAGYNSVHRDSVDLRDLTVDAPLLPGTACVLVLGEEAARRYLPQGVTLGEQRGSPLVLDTAVNGVTKPVVHVFSFLPQDAQDRANYFGDEGDGDDDDTETAAETKSTHGRTRRKNFWFWLKADIRKAVRLSQEGLKVKEPTYHLYPEAQEVIDLLSTTRATDLYFDIENEDNLQLTCFGFATSERDIYVVPMLQTHLPETPYYYDLPVTARILHALSLAFLRNRVVIHNAAYDTFVCRWRYGVPLPRRLFCTMLSFGRCGFIEVEKSLGHLMSYCTDLPYHKNEGIYKPWNASQADDLYRYNGKDVYALTQIKPRLEELAVVNSAVDNVNLVNRSLVAYTPSTLTGMRVDKAKVDARIGYNLQLMEKQQQVITTLAGFPLNARSHVAVGKYLYDKAGLAIKKPVKDPTNEKTLYQQLLKADIPLIPWIIKYRQKSKENGQIAFNPWERSDVLTPHTHPRFATQWRFTPVTFRRGSGAVKFRTAEGELKFSGNGQNWAKPLRHLCVADDGYSMGQVDEAGADARCVAWLCRPGEYRELFLHDIKPHTFIALHLFKDEWVKHFGKKTVAELCSLRVKALKSHPMFKSVENFIKATDKDEWKGMRYYFLGKKIAHAASYGMGARTFRLNVLQETEGEVNLSNDEAKHFLEFFFRLFPEILEWQRETAKTLETTRVLRNLFGHPRIFTSWVDEMMYKEAYAFSPQSTVGQVIAYAVCELDERKASGDELLNEADYTFLLDQHDAILFQCKTPLITEVTQEVSIHINRRLVNARGEEFLMKSESQMGVNWGFHS